MRVRRFLLVLGLLCIFLSNFMAIAAVPDSYTITYVNRGENLQVTSEERCFVLNNMKMRIELMENGELTEIGLYHKDRRSLYTLYPSSKLYSLHRMTEEDWAWGQKKADIAALGEKTGETQFLGYECDSYEKKTGNGTITTLVARDYELVLKIVTNKKGKIISQTEATEFNLTTPDAALFEVPAEYVDAMSL